MIESVPNVSEGRSREKIERIAAAIGAAGCRLLDLHSDPDHNRSVLTFVGDPDRLVEAVVSLAGSAIEEIDIRTHRGVHPRIGSLDVAPFVPLPGSSLAEAIRLARRAGSEIAVRYGIPVYLYGAAAPAGRRLAEIRRGGIAGLAARMRDDEWRPDFGPPRLHPRAGAVAVGAREVLVAYNVLLDTEEIAVGRRIASAIREKGGGLPGVMALAFYLESRGRVQISMNLTDIDATPIPRAFAAVRREAARYGVAPVESEIVGLVPRRALRGAEGEDLLFRRDPRGSILEDRI